MVSVEREGEQKRSLSYRKNKCVGCGICTDICPTEALRLGPLVPIARGLVDMDYVNVDKNKSLDTSIYDLLSSKMFCKVSKSKVLKASTICCFSVI